MIPPTTQSGPVFLVVPLENVSSEYVNQLSAHSFWDELQRMVEQGCYEQLESDSPILRYINLKPKVITDRRNDNESYLLIIDRHEFLISYRVA